MLNQEQLQQMAKDTGIPINDIAKALDIGPAKPAVTTAAEAQEEEALRKWREFSAQEVAQADTLDKARTAYNNAPDDSPEEAEAMRKWREFSAQEVTQADTCEKARKAHSNAPGGSPEEKEATRVWINLCTTPAEAQETYEAASSGSPEEAEAIRKIASFYAS